MKLKPEITDDFMVYEGRVEDIKEALLHVGSDVAFLFTGLVIGAVLCKGNFVEVNDAGMNALYDRTARFTASRKDGAIKVEMLDQ